VGTKDVRYGNGQYLSNIVPGTMTPAQLSRSFLGRPFHGSRFTHYVEIDATRLAGQASQHWKDSGPMRYLKVKWLQDSPDYPVLLYSEFDAQNWEVRKVEAYADGRMDFANEDDRSGDTKLGIEPFTPEEEAAIATDPEFEPSTITADEFEKVWSEAQRNRKPT
jgi:hypothetical protein